MAKNQQDPNDRLEKDGLDVILTGNSSVELPDGHVLELTGTITVNGIPLVGGGGGSGTTFTQAAPSSSWVINHNLGYKPAVDVYNAGSIKIMAEVFHNTINQTTITISPAVAGFARLI